MHYETIWLNVATCPEMFHLMLISQTGSSMGFNACNLGEGQSLPELHLNDINITCNENVRLEQN